MKTKTMMVMMMRIRIMMVMSFRPRCAGKEDLVGRQHSPLWLVEDGVPGVSLGANQERP